MAPIISIKNLSKQYDSGTKALDDVSLDIEQGEILAMLGPNGAGKTTLISTICGLVRPTSGSVTVGGYDIGTDFRQAREMIGLVPQELVVEQFEMVRKTLRFSRGLFGKPANDAYLEEVMKSLSLWDKRDSQLRALSGGMKRRVLIAKALAHEPKVLFLDETTAGVDVNLRRDMWELVGRLRDNGTTIILTTHYIEEAEEMADRVAVIDKGRIQLVQDKNELMRSFGHKYLRLELAEPLGEMPPSLADYELERAEDGRALIYKYDTRAERTGITRLIGDLAEAGIRVRDLDSSQSSLEDVFLGLLKEGADA